METTLLILVVAPVFGFGYFLANERFPSLWAAIGTFFLLMISAFASAYIESEGVSVAWKLGFRLIILNTFIMGYCVGYPRKRPWWKLAVFVNAAFIVGAGCYIIFAA